MKSPTLLIVNADDFGIARGVNRAVARAFDTGILRSASIMPNGAYFQDAVAIAKDRPGLGVGVHLALSQLTPVLPPDKIPHLTNGTGRLPETHWEFVRRSQLLKIPVSELVMEMSAQVERVLDHGLPITHLDSNGHLHFLPKVREAFLVVARRYGIRKTRMPSLHGRSRSVPEWLKAAAIRGTARKARVAFAEMQWPDYLWGLAASGEMDLPRVLYAVEHLPAGVNEMMTHPAEFDEDMHKTFRWGYHWEMELEALCDPAVPEALQRNGVALGNYNDF